MGVELHTSGKELFSVAKFESGFKKLLQTTGNKAHADFLKTTATFSTTVFFAVDLEQYRVKVSTTNQLYTMLNDGTKAHMIYPPEGGALRFPDAYGSKTVPGQLSSLPGYKSTNFIFTKLPVLHPGTKPRNFDKAVADKYRDVFTRDIENAISKAVTSKR